MRSSRSSGAMGCRLSSRPLHSESAAREAMWPPYRRPRFCCYVRVCFGVGDQSNWLLEPAKAAAAATDLERRHGLVGARHEGPFEDALAAHVRQQRRRRAVDLVVCRAGEDEVVRHREDVFRLVVLCFV